MRSASIPPPGLHHGVYTTLPISVSTSAAERWFSTRQASGPVTRNLAMRDMSMTPTASRTATCSRRARSKEWPRANAVSGVGGSGV